MLKIVLRTSAQRMRQNSALPADAAGNGGDHGATQAENKALRQRFAQQAAAQAAASVRAEGSDKLQQLHPQAGSGPRRDPPLPEPGCLACERQMIALRRENADLEAACEQAPGGAADGRGPCRKGRAAGCPDACLSGSAGAGPDAGTARRSCGLLCKTGRTACGAARNPCGSGKRSWRSFRWSCCAGLMK